MHEAASGGRSDRSRNPRGTFLHSCGNSPGPLDKKVRDPAPFGFLDDVFVDFVSDTGRLFVYCILGPDD